MRAGDLRRRVTIQQKSVTRDTYGAEVVSWTDVATVWASVEDLSGRELYDAERITTEVTTRIRMRYRAGITTDMRAVYGARTFNIRAVLDPEGRKRELQLLVAEVTT